jgi:hypothetical protein
MSVCKRPRNRLHAFSDLAVSSLTSCNLKGAFIRAPTIQQMFVVEAGDRVLSVTVLSFHGPPTTQVLVASSLLLPPRGLAGTGSVSVVLFDREVDRSLHHHGKRTDG